MSSKKNKLSKVFDQQCLIYLEIIKPILELPRTKLTKYRTKLKNYAIFKLFDEGKYDVAFEKMILVNMPLMINFHKTKAYLAAIPKTEIIAVYGELDPSFRYVPFLSGKFQNLNVLKIPKADHNFAGMRTEFIDLSELLFET